MEHKANLMKKTTSKSEEVWYVNSEASNHMTSHEEWFSFLEKPGDNVLNNVVNETNAKTLWNKFETLYASRTGNNKLFLLKQAMHLTYKENNSIFYRLNEFQGCFDQLSSMGIKFEVIALWLLSTLP